MEALQSDRAAVEARIRAAFAGVTLGKGMSLRQAQVADRYGEGVTEAEYQALPRGEVTNSWADVSLSELERDCVAHLDNEGLRYYSALMLSLLSNYEPASMRVIGIISALYPAAIGPERRYTYLTDDQHRAVACFVEALPRLVALTQKTPSAFRGHYATTGDGLPSEDLGFICERTEMEILRYIRAALVDRPKARIVMIGAETPEQWRSCMPPYELHSHE